MLDSEILLSGVTVNAVTPIFCIPVQYSLVNILARTVFPSEFCMGIQNSISKLCIPQCIPIVDTACIHPTVSALKIYQWQRSGIPREGGYAYGKSWAGKEVWAGRVGCRQEFVEVTTGAAQWK